MPRTVALRFLASIVLTAWGVGCAATPTKPPLMADVAQEDVTVARLRAMDYEFASRFGQTVAATAMDIAARTENPVVRDRAYQWRLWATPQARAAAFDQDPVAGLIELWVLAGQQHRYFAEGAGSKAFEDEQALAVAAADELEHNVREITESIVKTESFEKLSARVDAWIAEHPMEGRFYIRPTARADLAAFVSDRNSRSGFQAVGSIEETFRDLNDRLTILSTQLPVEARWQAEYLTNALFEDHLEEPADAALGAMKDLTEIAREFEATLTAQTNALLDGFQKERIAVFDAVGGERAILVEAIEKQRDSAVTAIDQHLISATTRLDEVGRGLIDHFFVRLIEVLVAIGIFVLGNVALVLWVLRRRHTGND